MRVRHTASVAAGGDTRACNADREAIVLLKSEDAETLLQNGDRYRRPPKPAARPAPVLWMGVGRQPECIAGMVVRAKSVDQIAAVVHPVTCRTPHVSFQARFQGA